MNFQTKIAIKSPIAIGAEKSKQTWIPVKFFQRQNLIHMSFSIAKESTGSTCTCQVQALPVDSQLTICQHEIARNYLQLGSKNLKNCK